VGHRAIELLIMPSVATVCSMLVMAAAWKLLYWAFANPGTPKSRRS